MTGVVQLTHVSLVTAGGGGIGCSFGVVDKQQGKEPFSSQCCTI